MSTRRRSCAARIIIIISQMCCAFSAFSKRKKITIIKKRRLNRIGNQYLEYLHKYVRLTKKYDSADVVFFLNIFDTKRQNVDIFYQLGGGLFLRRLYVSCFFFFFWFPSPAHTRVVPAVFFLYTSVNINYFYTSYVDRAYYLLTVLLRSARVYT